MTIIYQNLLHWVTNLRQWHHTSRVTSLFCQGFDRKRDPMMTGLTCAGGTSHRQWLIQGWHRCSTRKTSDPNHQCFWNCLILMWWCYFCSYSLLFLCHLLDSSIPQPCSLPLESLRPRDHFLELGRGSQSNSWSHCSTI